MCMYILQENCRRHAQSFKSRKHKPCLSWLGAMRYISRKTAQSSEQVGYCFSNFRVDSRISITAIVLYGDVYIWENAFFFLPERCCPSPSRTYLKAAEYPKIILAFRYYFMYRFSSLNCASKLWSCRGLLLRRQELDWLLYHQQHLHR